MDIHEFISAKTKNFSGADITALIREASLIAAREDILLQDDRMEADEDDNIELGIEHFEKASSRVTSSISEKDRIYYQKLKDKLQK